MLTLAPLLTNWGSHSIALGVNEASDLCEVAVALADVLNAGGLHQERIVGGQHTLDSLAVVFHQSRVLTAAHEGPHLLICRNLRLLEEQELLEIVSVSYKIRSFKRRTDTYSVFSP